jgi:hypothetical protein
MLKDPSSFPFFGFTALESIAYGMDKYFPNKTNQYKGVH